MKPEFETYLKKIGFTTPFLEKAERVYSFYFDIYGEQIEDIFVSEYVDDDGKRIFENLWFFTSYAVMEAKNFLFEDNFDAMCHSNIIVLWRIKNTNIEGNVFNSESRIYLTFSVPEDFHADYKASGNNCKHLMHIFHKYIKTNRYIYN